MTIAEYFLKLRLDKNHHLGMGDILLTMGQQDEIVEMFLRPEGANHTELLKRHLNFQRGILPCRVDETDRQCLNRTRDELMADTYAALGITDTSRAPQERS